MMSIPNILSLGRLILVPVFAVLFFAAPEYSWTAALVLLVSGITDFLDGFIARKYQSDYPAGKDLGSAG